MAAAATGRRSRRRLAAVAVGGVVAFAGAVGVGVATSGGSSGEVASPQHFILPALSGPGTVALSGYAGRPVVVNFFASWCDTCGTELPVFASEARRWRGAVTVVEVDTLETGDGAAFARRFDLQGSVAAVASDQGGFDGKGLYRALGGTGAMPMTAFYSSTGALLGTHTGGYDAGSLTAAVRRYFGPVVPA